MTPPLVARVWCVSLFGDAGYRTTKGTEVAEWFMTLEVRDAFSEYYDMLLLPEGFRPRDVEQRMGEDIA